MKNYTSQIIIGLAIVLIVGALVYTNKKTYIPEPVQTVTPQTTTATTTPVVATTTTATTSVTAPASKPAVSGITMAQVAEHNTAASCWSVVNGNVYDLTSWIENHPGGKKRILAMCGVDGSVAYNGEHGFDEKALGALAGFKIGVLVQ